jgi:3-oxoacyl-[acyl-carrier-protein] synthase III
LAERHSTPGEFPNHRSDRRSAEDSARSVYVNLDRYGNTSAAAVAIALDEANRTGRIKAGDYVLMVVFGGGLTWASTVIEW